MYLDGLGLTPRCCGCVLHSISGVSPERSCWKGAQAMKRELGAAAQAFLFAATLAGAPVGAQTVTGVLGQPSATTTIDGKQLPPPPPKFGGVITDTYLTSKSWWPPRIVPPKGAPNVLLIMT